MQTVDRNAVGREACRAQNSPTTKDDHRLIAATCLVLGSLESNVESQCVPIHQPHDVFGLLDLRQHVQNLLVHALGFELRED